MKIYLSCIVILLSTFVDAVAQGYNSDKIALTNFLVRMCQETPFEGVRVVDTYNRTYLISVLILDPTKYKTEATLNRVASVKSMAQAVRYFNGSSITQEMIIHTTENDNGMSDTEIIEIIKENSIGHVKTLEQLVNFKRQDGMQVLIFAVPLVDK